MTIAPSLSVVAKESIATLKSLGSKRIEFPVEHDDFLNYADLLKHLSSRK